MNKEVVAVKERNGLAAAMLPSFTRAGKGSR